MRAFVYLTIAWVFLVAAHCRTISISPSCSSHADQVALGLCLRPFLDAWEILRQHEATASHIVFPTLYYTRQEILTLCDFYLESLDTCMDSHVLEACSNSTLLSFVKSQVGFICTSDRAVKFLSMFDCISGAFRATPECRDHIRGLPLPELQANKCRNMPGFFTCLEREIYNRCSTDGLVTLIRAIEGFGCDTRKLQLSKALGGVGASFSFFNYYSYNTTTQKSNIEDFVVPQTDTTSPQPSAQELPQAPTRAPAQPLQSLDSQDTHVQSIQSTQSTTKQQESLIENNQVPAKSRVDDVEENVAPNAQLEKLPASTEGPNNLQGAASVTPVVRGFAVPADEVMKEKNIRIMSMIDAVQVDMGSGEEEEEEAFKAQITNEPPSSSEEAETALDSVKQESMLMESILGEELAVMGIKSPEVVEVPLEGSGDVPVEVAQEQVESVEPVESSPPEKTILTEVVGAGVEVEDSDGPILHILVNQPPIPAISELPVEQPVDPPSVSPPQEIIINSSAVVPAALEIPEISDDPKAVSDPSASKSVEKPDIDLELPVNPPPVNPPQVVITNPSETVPTAPMIPKIIEDPEAVPDLSASKSVEKPDVQFKDTLKAQSVEFVQSRVCSPAQEEEIMKCLVPLSDRWQAIQTRDPAVGRFKFSLFNHRTEDLIDLCDVVQATFDDCIVGDLLRDCRSNIFIQFVETQLGLACGSKQRDFFLSYDCLVITHLQHGARCLEHVRGNLLPGMPDEEKCAGIPEYFSCMEEEILESCNPTSHFIFLEAVQNFGCDIRKKAAVIEEKVADVSSGSENVELQNEHLEVKKLVDTAEDSLVRIPAEDKIVEQPKVEVTIVTTPKPKKKIRVKPVPPFQPVLSSQCTPAIQGEVRACLLPLMEFWVGLRNQKMELNNVSFPIFKYKRGEILNLCDEYANAFLQCDFALFEVCLGDEMVRFANNNLGYLCSPQNIQPFMKHFDCISEQVRSSPEECLELIHGPSLPGLDTMRCSGMQEFYQCVGPRVKSKCQGGALFEFQETIVQFGCRINRFLV